MSSHATGARIEPFTHTLGAYLWTIPSTTSCFVPDMWFRKHARIFRRNLVWKSLHSRFHYQWHHMRVLCTWIFQMQWPLYIDIRVLIFGYCDQISVIYQCVILIGEWMSVKYIWLVSPTGTNVMQWFDKNILL